MNFTPDTHWDLHEIYTSFQILYEKVQVPAFKKQLLALLKESFSIKYVTYLPLINLWLKLFIHKARETLLLYHLLAISK